MFYHFLFRFIRSKHYAFLSSEGCRALALALCHDCVSENCSIPHLCKLNLSCCHINDEGINYMASVIQKNWDLELLDLSGNKCQSRVFSELFTSLQSCRNLSSFNLSRHSIGDFSVFCSLNSIPIQELNLGACAAKLSSLSSLAISAFITLQS